MRSFFLASVLGFSFFVLPACGGGIASDNGRTTIDPPTETGSQPAAADENTVSRRCSEICANGVAAACPNVYAPCQGECESSYSEAKTKGCVALWDALDRCMRSASYVCGTGGYAYVSGCTPETYAWIGCMHPR